MLYMFSDDSARCITQTTADVAKATERFQRHYNREPRGTLRLIATKNGERWEDVPEEEPVAAAA